MFQMYWLRVNPGCANEPAPLKSTAAPAQTETDCPPGEGAVMVEFCEGGSHGVVQITVASKPGEVVFACPLSWKTSVKQPVGLLTVAVT
jgi:hypothetical protein